MVLETPESRLQPSFQFNTRRVNDEVDHDNQSSLHPSSERATTSSHDFTKPIPADQPKATSDQFQQQSFPLMKKKSSSSSRSTKEPPEDESSQQYLTSTNADDENAAGNSKTQAHFSGSKTITSKTNLSGKINTL